MNAKEFAHELEKAASFIRQQQAEIDTYKLQNNNQIDTYRYKNLTDEEIINIFNNWTNNKQEHNLPANNQNYFYQEMREFARAILRKASEK